MSTQTEPKLVTQIDFARAGQITPQMKEVAEREHRDPEYIRERVADGRIAIPANIVHIKKGMRAHDFEQVVLGKLDQRLFHVADGVVHGDGAYHERRLVDELLAELARLA